MKAPADESAVHTTPPMIKAATIPCVPFKPTSIMMMLERMRVMSVIPLTGLEPTIAMAFAATVVKRNAITATIKMPTIVKSKLPSIGPTKKKIVVTKMVMSVPMAIIFIERSRCVRTSSACCAPPLEIFPIKANALLITPQLFTTPMIPAMAIAPIPMLLA